MYDGKLFLAIVVSSLFTLSGIHTKLIATAWLLRADAVLLDDILCLTIGSDIIIFSLFVIGILSLINLVRLLTKIYLFPAVV